MKLKPHEKCPVHGGRFCCGRFKRVQKPRLAAKRLSQEVFAFGETQNTHTDRGQGPEQTTLKATEL